MTSPSNKTPPPWLDKLLEFFCAPHLLEEVMGDLHERYQLRAQKQGIKQARKQYLREVLSYVRPGILKRKPSDYPTTLDTAMVKNYFVIAMRNLLGRKVYAAINVLGLSIGMACCLLIFQYVAFEHSFDRFHTHTADLYRVLQAGARNGEAMDLGSSYTAQSLAPALTAEIPEIQYITRLHSDNAVVSVPAQPGQVIEENGILYADPDFLKMFSFPLLAGRADKALEPGSVLLSESAARKYFGNTSPLGQVLEVTGQLEQGFRVSGIFQDVPANSHLQFSMLLPMQDLLRGEQYSTEPEGGWSWNNFSTYLQLHQGADTAAVAQKMTSVYLKHRGEVLREQGFRSALHLQALSDIHLNAAIGDSVNAVMGDHRSVYFFTIIGLITLGIALVNYVNLATARALNRAREVGVRKVIGAQRRQLILQFLCESALTNAVAAAFAVALAIVLMPTINELAETQLTLSLWMNPYFWLAFLATLSAGTLLAGFYPALLLSSFRPVAVLKGKAGSFATQLWLRRGLVVVQFTVSIVLIAGTVVVYKQLHYMRSMDLGLDLEQVLTVQGPRVLPEGDTYAAVTANFLQTLRQMPAVQQVASSWSLPGKGFNWNGASIRKVTDEPANAIRGVVTYVDSSFADLYGLQLVAGSSFNNFSLSEAEDAPWLVAVNEKTVKSLGFASAEEALQQSLNIGGEEAQIVGVYQDFNWSSAHGEQQNMVLGYTGTGLHISIRLLSQELPATIAQIQAAYEQRFPGNVFQYAFADETFDQQYRNDQRFARLFSVFAALAIFIACLGLFGLAAFTAQQRHREIGIRKVLGATATHVVALLSKDFLRLVVIGFIMAVPIAWYLMNHWLEEFAYRTQIGAGIFLLAGLGAVVIALATVSWQSIRAAWANPADSLRQE